MSESNLKNDIKAYLKKQGVYYAPVAQGNYGKQGDPDLIACCNGRFIAIEAKVRDGGRQSNVQKTRQMQIEADGSDGIYILAKSVDDVKKIVEEIRNGNN